MFEESPILERRADPTLEAATPAALIQQGTTPNQAIFTGTLASLPGIVERAKPRPPTLLVVGSVVSLHDKLKWFSPQAAAPNAAVNEAARLSLAADQ